MTPGDEEDEIIVDEDEEDGIIEYCDEEQDCGPDFQDEEINEDKMMKYVKY